MKFVKNYKYIDKISKIGAKHNLNNLETSHTYASFLDKNHESSKIGAKLNLEASQDCIFNDLLLEYILVFGRYRR